jgi:hypothetical protein
MLSARTLQTYNIAIKKIRDAVAPGSEGLEFLYNAEAIIKFVEGTELSINSKKGLYIACKSQLRNLPEGAGRTHAETKIGERMNHYRDEHNKIAAEQNLSPREEALWVEWPKVIAARKLLKESSSSLWELQDYIIYCLYTLTPPLRLDYARTRIVFSVAELSGCSENALVWDSNPRFILREYKTAAKYGVVELPVPPELQEELSEWLDLNQSDWLLCKESGEPMDDNALAGALRRVFTKAVGKPLSCSILRHIYISYMRRGEMPWLEQQDLAKAMCHSAQMSVLYRKL